MRPLIVLLHRYLGLATALFLALAGLTGSLLAFQHEIDEWLNPAFYHAPARGPLLSPGELVQRIEQAEPRLQVWYMEVPDEAGHSALMAAVPRTDPATGAPYDLHHRVIYLDPVSGAELGMRQWGACCLQAQNLIPFLLEFHYTLALPGNWGLMLMGLVAILWVIDCFASAWLTLPRGRPFLRKWWTAWTLKRGAGRYRRTLDQHRAGGLWLWLLLLPVAVSSVAMNLPEPVFKPVVSLFSEAPPSTYQQRSQMPREALGETRLDYQQVYRLAQAEGARQGIEGEIGELYYSVEYNFFGAGFGGHDANPLEKSWLFFDGADGRLIGAEVAGRGTPGERFYRLQAPIHGGRIAGLPGRIVIALLGLAIAGLSVTGVVIWWRKRQARRASAARAREGRRAAFGQNL
ncbi:PepSY-associated TM helix domain-containing protein [Metapseudomonas otitidis]|uniref:PepSY-associated TM helix domain-containing protein n=1 Tax=Metapseudomonas otitidis TaxID=319939 RepID=UPI003EDF7648